MELAHGIFLRLDRFAVAASVQVAERTFRGRATLRHAEGRAPCCRRKGCRPRIGRDHPLNLSISISGGRETNWDSLSNGERTGKRPSPNPTSLRRRECGVREGAFASSERAASPLDWGCFPGRVSGPWLPPRAREAASPESGCLGVQPQEGGRLHLRLNTAARPIANKYREGKLKRTLKREFKSA